MNYEHIETELVELARQLDIDIRHVRYDGLGGLCTIKGRRTLVLNDGLDTPDRIDIIARALASVPGTDRIFLLPEIRDLLSKYQPEGK